MTVARQLVDWQIYAAVYPGLADLVGQVEQLQQHYVNEGKQAGWDPQFDSRLYFLLNEDVPNHAGAKAHFLQQPNKARRIRSLSTFLQWCDAFLTSKIGTMPEIRQVFVDVLVEFQVQLWTEPADETIRVKPEVLATRLLNQTTRRIDVSIKRTKSGGGAESDKPALGMFASCGNLTIRTSPHDMTVRLESQAGDPFWYLPAASVQKLAGRWLMLSVQISHANAQTQADVLSLYASDSDQITEQCRLYFPYAGADRVVERPFLLSDTVKTIRVDPFEGCGSALLHHFSIRPLKMSELVTALSSDSDIKKAYRKAVGQTLTVASLRDLAGSQKSLSDLLETRASTMGMEILRSQALAVQTAVTSDARQADVDRQYVKGDRPVLLVATQDLKLREGVDAVWQSTGTDPAFEVSLTDTEGLHAGWIVVRVEMQSDRPLGTCSVYLDRGQGYSENSVVIWKQESAVVMEQLLYSDADPVAIRFDPGQCQGQFAIRQFAIYNTTSMVARRMMLQRLMAVYEAFRGLSATEVAKQLNRQSIALKQTVESLLYERYDSLRYQDERRQAYGEWIKRVESPSLPGASEVAQMMADFDRQPLISIVIPVYNTSLETLSACIESVLAQHYPHWELCIADDASPSQHVRDVLSGYKGRDPRIKTVFRRSNGHISLATNSALKLASGDFVAFVDHDDTLSPFALLYCAQAINRQPQVQLIYTDEDKLSQDGVRFDPHFKPDWNRDLFFSQNYISHLTVVRRELVSRVGGLSKGMEGSQDQDLLLKLLPHLQDDNIVHIPRVLYHWRAVAGSTAKTSAAKDYTTQAGIRALRGCFKSLGVSASVSKGLVPNTYRIRYAVPVKQPKVSVIIPTRNRHDLLKQCIQSVMDKTTYQNYEIVVVDNQSDEQATLNYFEQVSSHENVRVIPFDAPFNYSAINNHAVEQCDSDILILLNNDIEVISPDWMTELVSHALRPDVGCVGAKLYYPDGRIQHAGVVLGIGGVAGHSHKYFPANAGGYFSRLFLVQNYSAVTAACLAVRRSVYRQVGGLDEKNLQIAFNDVDFCLKVRQAGLRNVWTPYAELIHHESVSRGAEDNPEKVARFNREAEFMKAKWSGSLMKDPAYNENLTLQAEDFSLRPR